MASHNEETSDEKFKIAEQAIKKVDALLDLDKDDEALRKWKEQLLGNATQAYSPKDDPRRVVVTDMVIVCDGRPAGDIVYKFDNKQELEKLKESPFILKEGCQYKIKLRFRVQHELVTGLKHVNTVYRKGVKVDKEETMIGSFGPQKDPHDVVIPRNGWDEAPKGLVARGKYKAQAKFVDDDGQVHLEYEYAFAIKKDWKGKDKK